MSVSKIQNVFQCVWLSVFQEDITQAESVGILRLRKHCRINNNLAALRTSGKENAFGCWKNIDIDPGQDLLKWQ